VREVLARTLGPVLVAAALFAGAVGFAQPAEAAPLAADGAGPATPGLLEREVERQSEALGLHDVEAILAELNHEMEGDLPPINIKDVARLVLRGEGPYTFAGFAAALAARLGREVWAGSGLMVRLVILALLSGFLQNIQSAFARKETSDLAFAACNLVLIILAAGGFVLALRTCQGIIDRLVNFMQAMLPVMITLLAGLGAVTTAGLYNPILVTSLQFVALFVRDTAIPIVVCAACVDLVSRTFTQFKLTSLADLLRQGTILVTGVMMALFLGLVTAYGAAGSVSDGVAIKAAKFATSNFVPFVGKVLSDAVDVVIGSSLVLKNVIGVVGAMAIVAFTVFPLLKVLSLVVIYRVAGAVVQPLGGEPLVSGLNSVGNSLVLMMVLALTVSILFLVTMAIVVGAARAAVMVR
jgi:stage III sporulation protein AE